MKRAASIFSMAIIILAIVSTPFARSEQTATSHRLGIVPQLERKDTYLLNLQYPLSGPYAWDIPHENRAPEDSDRCIKATLSMVASYYGGHLSQDRILYYTYHEVLQYKCPEEDLGYPSQGIVTLNVADLLYWALIGESIARFVGKPDFSAIKLWIDSDFPIIRDDGGQSHLITVIDGYDTDGQMVYLIDPIIGNETKVPYDSLNVFVVWVVTGDHLTARSDEPTIWMDSDGDGVVDFDEINRFHTDPSNNDTYGLGIDDKTAIEYMYMDHLTFPTAAFKSSPDTPLTNEQITFDASESTGNIAAYSWKFGDNNVTTVTEPTINHAYEQQGTYNVTLTVNDTNGLWNSTTSSLTVGIQKPPSNGSLSDTVFYRQSLGRTGYASTEGPETPDVLWTSNLNDPVTTSPAMADGKVFVGTTAGTLYALDLKTGETIWTFNTGSSISTSPACQNGVVFFGTQGPGRIYALEESTGLVQWLYEAPSGIAFYSSPAVVDNKVIVGSSNGNLLCLNCSDGHVLWTVHLSSGYLSSPAIQNETVFVTSNIGVHAVDILNGAIAWEYTTHWPVTSCPAVADGLVLVGTENDDRVYSLNQSTGQPVWSLLTGGWLTPPAVDSLKQLVIVGSKDYKLYCLDEQTGFLKWYHISGPNYPSAPTISSDGLVYLGTSDGSLYCVNETTGKEIWKYKVTASIVSSPTMIDKHVLVGTLEGKIYCFGPPFPVNNSTVADIAVSNLTVSKSEVAQGYSLQIDATAENHGDSMETFNMTTYVNGTTIETREITVMNGSSATIAIIWNTTGFATGNYTISAYAWPVPGETNTADNNFTSPTPVEVTMPGDLMLPFGVIDMKDIAYVAKHFATSPSSPLWDPNADINGDGKVDMKDIAIVAKNFGKHSP